MESRIETLIKHGDQLFSKRLPLMSLWQEIADNFYPERADFTMFRNQGQDFASNLTTSFPLLCRRDLGNAFASMLRPNDRDWFHTGTMRDDKVDNEGKRWLEWANGIQRRAMYDRKAQLTRATTEGDHDFAAFGQCVLSAELNHSTNTLLYRCWHIRDVAWCEGADGQVGTVYRKWVPEASLLKKLFPKTVSNDVTKRLKDTPYEKINVRHVVVPSEDYEPPQGKKKWRQPYVHIFFELENGNILEEVGSFNRYYVIPRWQTVSGSQYAYSPATVAAMPDARLLQAITLVLLEAGEKAVNPPLVMKHDILRSDMNIFPGGLTHVDLESDERIQDALQLLTNDSRGIPLGIELRNDAKEMIAQAFYLNKLNLPPAGGPEMTAFEAGQRVQEYIRAALPLFGPMEIEYNGALCETTFDLMLRGGGFGSFHDIPDSIRGQDIQFHFESPLHDALGKQKGQTWLQAKTILADVAALDPTAASMVDARTALRDVLDGIGVPAKWVRNEKQMDQIDEANKEKQSTQELLATLQQGGAAAEQIGKAGQAFNGIQAGATAA